MSASDEHTEIVKTERGSVEAEESSRKGPQVGEWYWVMGEKAEGGKWLGCVIEIGSNYAEIQDVHGGSIRVHFDTFDSVTKREHNPQAIIDSNIEHYKGETKRLIGDVKALTAKLALTPAGELPSADRTEALVLHSKRETMKEYQKALVKAETKQLPKLFKEIEESNKGMARWMKANLIPLQAQAKALEDSMDRIKDRVFNVELYAGLVETVVQIQDGEPAPNDEKIRLFQRRLYMDEECLAEYEIGGMQFASIDSFEKWLRRSDNMDRLLPFPRCVVAFRVRRHRKNRSEEAFSIEKFINMMFVDKEDDNTFLYLRNGEQVYRLKTGIEFDEKLFPDLDRQMLDHGSIYARMFADRVDHLISEAEYQGLVEAHQKHEEELKTVPETDKFWKRCHCELSHYDPYTKFTPDDVHHDDIAKYIERQIAQHNRVVIILQGLLDRSPVFQPHPPWQIWTPLGFQGALELIYDSSRALTNGEKPDFEAFRAKLNASLKPGSLTVGQEDAWERHEAEKYNESIRSDYRMSYEQKRYMYKVHHRPHGNEGPGTVARVVKVSRDGTKCTYRWARERMRFRYGADDKLAAEFTCSTSALINVDAYKPGDFKVFFRDPRTREEYLKWAPLLLIAEEYHAGTRNFDEPLLAFQGKKGKKKK